MHIGTGNYNRATAQIYTDLGLFTANKDIVADVSELFNGLTGYSRQTRYRALLVAPTGLRDQLTALIEREIAHAKAGGHCGIVIKNNSISDPDIVRLLYRASQNGVRVDAIVRGICCLRPGIPGFSDLIRVRSVVGRFLEHSRIYCFENGGDAEVYIGSADLMERNLDRRVEVLLPGVRPRTPQLPPPRAVSDLPSRRREGASPQIRRTLRAGPRARPGTLDAQQILISHRIPGS